MVMIAMNTKNIFKAIVTAAFLVSVMMTSCTKDPDNGGAGSAGEPTFPELVENYAVDTLETIPAIVFTPNYDWEITIPVEVRQWFWFKDGSMNVRRLTGKASKDPIYIYVCESEYRDFDKNHSCEVTLTMDGKSQVVAKYMIRAKERALAVYSAMWDNGSLKVEQREDVDENGNVVVKDCYVYPQEEATSASLQWSASDADFRAPIKVEANCEWDVEKPEWLELNVPENNSGIVELVLTGESLTDVSGTVVFKSGDEQLAQINISLPSCNDISVYSAKVSDGDLEYGEDGYAYTEDSVSEVSLLWLGNDFRIPVKVDSKCNWTLVCPDWLTVSSDNEKTTGEILMTMMGVPSKYPLEATSGKIAFMKENVLLKELDVNFPGCKDILQYGIAMSLTSLDYDYEGFAKTSVGYEDVVITGDVLSTNDARIFAVETTGGNLAENPDWFTITISSWNNADGADVLQNRTMSFDVTENTGNERSAVMFILPATVTASASELFNEDLSVKEEYAAYAVPVVQKSKNYSDYITINPVEDADFTFVRADETRTAELAEIFGETQFAYVLTYEKMYASDDAAMYMAIPYTSVKVFDKDDVINDKSGDDSFWLNYVNYVDANNYGVVRMYIDMTLPTSASTGYVVFYDSMGSVLAIVECVSPFKEEIVTPPDPGEEDNYLSDEYGNKFELNDTYFTNKSAAKAAGVTMYECKSGPYYDQYKEFCVEDEIPIMILEYTDVDTEIEIKVPTSISYWSVMPYVYRSYITLNGERIESTQGIMSRSTNKVKIKMSESVFTDREQIEADGAKGCGLKVLLHKDMGTESPSMVIFCRLNVQE